MKRTARPGSSSRWIRVALVNIVIFLLLVEGASFLLIFSSENRLHYFQPPEQILSAQIETDELTRFRIHPYFGVIQKPGSTIHDHLAANNCGFSTDYDFPHLPASDEEYIIGIFGGSVAEMFADVAQHHFRRELRKIDALRDRDIVILNFARGAYKQPQQLLVLTYFLALGQHFDLVINLDGFNEVALAQGNADAGIDISMPSVEHILPLVSLINDGTMTVGSVDLLHRLTRCREKVARGEEAMNSSVLASSYVARRFAYWRNRENYVSLLNDYSESLVSRGSGSLICLYDDLTGGDSAADDVGDAIRLWKTASIEMHLLSAAHGFHYCHFIQPNQYYSEKVFTAEELEVAIRPGSHRQVHAEAGYPALLQEIDGLRSSGIAVHSLVDAFDDISQTVYVDDCCHFNRRGNFVIAEKIAALIKQEMN